MANIMTSYLTDIRREAIAIEAAQAQTQLALQQAVDSIKHLSDCGSMSKVVQGRWPSGKRQPLVKKLKIDKATGSSGTSQLTASTTTSSTIWYTTAGTGGGGSSCSPKQKPALVRGDIDVWEVGDALFDDYEAACEYSRNKMMAGITQYPKQSWLGEDIEHTPNDKCHWVTHFPSGNQYHKTLDHARAYIRSEKVGKSSLASKVDWSTVASRDESIPEQCRGSERFFIKWEGDWIVIDQHHGVVARRFGVLDHAVDYCVSKNTPDRPLDPNKDIRRAHKSSKWIVANHYINKDFICASHEEAKQYIDVQNKIAANKRKSIDQRAIDTEIKQQQAIAAKKRAVTYVDVADKSPYYVKRDGGLWCVFTRATKHFGYDTKVVGDPATGILYCNSYLTARQRAKQLNADYRCDLELKSSSESSKALDEIFRELDTRPRDY